MHKNYSKGFTLIELLVVIAIIGILSAVVLASLNTARQRGADASIQANLASVRVQSELYFSGQTPNTYGVLAWSTGPACYPATGLHMFSTAGDATIQRAMAATDAANGGGTVGCWSDGANYVVAAQLVANTGTYWCIDNRGASHRVTGTVPLPPAAGLIVCPAPS